MILRVASSERVRRKRLDRAAGCPNRKLLRKKINQPRKIRNSQIATLTLLSCFLFSQASVSPAIIFMHHVPASGASNCMPVGTHVSIHLSVPRGKCRVGNSEAAETPPTVSARKTQSPGSSDLGRLDIRLAHHRSDRW